MISVRTGLNYLAIIRGQNIVSLFPSNLSGFEKLIMGLTRIGIKKKKKESLLAETKIFRHLSNNC